MVEEWDVASRCLLSRRWKAPGALGGADGAWAYEIGESKAAAALANAPKAPSAASGGSSGGGGGGGGGFTMSVSRSNPRFCTPRDTPRTWEWRVERLPYAMPTYSVTVDTARDDLVLRTSNKKYFKRWHVPALRRAGLALAEGQVALRHDAGRAGGTLFVAYTKPPAVAAADAERRERVFEMEALDMENPGAGGRPGEGDAECAQQ